MSGLRRIAIAGVLAAGWVVSAPHAHADLAYEQLGGDLDGGPVVALSDAGDRLAIGSPMLDGTGVVRVFEWDGSAWTQLGADLRGEASGDEFGFSVSLSGDGGRLAVGAYRNAGGGDPPGCSGTCPEGGHVRVFEWDGAGWVQLGDDVDGVYYSGSDAKLNDDGGRLAVGSWSYVRVLDWDGTDWDQVGSDLLRHEGEIAMSADGLRLAVGSPVDDSLLTVYDWDGSDWTVAGSRIDGDDLGIRYLGGCVTMAADGGRVAACGDRGGDAIIVTIEWDGSDWVRVGSELDGFNDAMSADGNRLARIDPVAIFDWDGDDWVTTSPLPSGDRYAALSADGNVIAVGVPPDTVRVFGISEIPTTTTTTTTIPTATSTTSIPTAPASTTSTTTPIPSTALPDGTLPPTGSSLPGGGGVVVAVTLIGAGGAALAVRRRSIERSLRRSPKR